MGGRCLRLSRSVMVAVSLLVMQFGCAAPLQPGGSDVRPPPAYPAWVIRGSAYTSADTGRSFVGVGVVFGIRNQALGRTTADNRARAEAAKLFAAFATALVADYAATASAMDPGASANSTDRPPPAQTHEQTLKLLTASTLNAVALVGRWQQPDDGSIYSLARLDLHSFLDGLARLSDLDADFVSFARRRAESLHRALEQSQGTTTQKTGTIR